MDVQINSHQIISECLQQYGKGQLFFRTDGLQFEERRAELRRAYLESSPGIEPEYRQAISDAAATPGMTMEQLIAAWGLLEEDTRIVFGHVTDDGLSAYAYFNKFNVGPGYTIYLKDDVIFGIRETGELVAPHELELTMRLAEENLGVYYFYEGGDGFLRGSDVDQFHIDWDTLHLHLYRVETVLPCSTRNIENHLRMKGLVREYELALVRLGYDSRSSAPAELRSRVALGILPYPSLRRGEPEQGGTSPAPGTIDAQSQQAQRAPIPLPPSRLAPPEDPTLVPPEEWFAYIADRRQAEAAFPCFDDRVELLKVEWMRERLFRVDQVPLLVNGVSLYDLVEVEWQDGDIIPRFKRVAEGCGYRTVRAVLKDSSREESVRRFAKVNAPDAKMYRYENGVLAFTVAKSGLDEIMREWLGYLPLSWIYTDTLTQD